MNNNIDTNKGMIAWFARNSVAANLLMFVLIIGGLFSAFNINKEVFPSFELNYLTISVAYPGAAPQEIEEGIVIKIEEAIRDLNGIKKVTSIASEGVGRVNIEVMEDYDPKVVLDEAKMRVDAISTFPDNIEKPDIFRIKPENQVINIGIYGDIAASEMKELAKEVRDELTALPGVTRAKVQGALDYQIAIEVSEDKLREYQLTFAEVAAAVQRSSIDLPGGSIRAADGDILLRTKSQAYVYEDFANITLKTQTDGTRILLVDVATIKDDFEERIAYTRFNGKPAVMVQVNSIDNQDALQIAENVKRYIEQKRESLPANVSIDTWADLTHYLQGRLDMMLENMFAGAILVFIILAFFLDLKLAFWVMMGLPVCFLGTLLIMPVEPLGLSINMLTLFAFILVLGIVVDDAIVMGESAYTEIERSGHNTDSVIRGTLRVAMPATFGVLTTIAAFVPMVMVTGNMSVIWTSIGWVVILCLIFSLIESKLILPAHLVHMSVSKKNRDNKLTRFKARLNQRLNHFINHSYKHTIEWLLSHRAVVVASFLGLLIFAFSLVGSGHIRSIFFPAIPSDYVQVQLKMEDGVSDIQTLKAVQILENKMYELDERLLQETGERVIQHSFFYIGARTEANFFIELTKAETRLTQADTIVEMWRDSLPAIPSIKKLNINASTGPQGGDLSLRLIGDDFETLAKASKELREKLATYEGIEDISDDFSSGSKEIKLQILPLGETMGLSISDLARQVRYAFYGFEAQRILRNKEEVKVLVRYPRDERNTIDNLNNMQVKLPNGERIAFDRVAKLEIGKSLSTIVRVDGMRAITVTASANKQKAEPAKVVAEVQKEFFPELKKRYPSVKSELDGASLDEQNASGALAQGFFLAMFVIYALMAIPLKSYSKPLIIMTVIPFGIIGALLGHLLIGISLNVLSFCGIVALAGVVVNDSLILVDRINQGREAGLSAKLAVIEAGCARFRAIVLTSLTTFFGLVPILLEKSLQAKIVIPMATSLAFGIVFSTLVTLILVPVLYSSLSDFKANLKRFYQWWWQPQH